MLLFYASPLFNPEGKTDRWQAAADIARDLIDDGKYTLHNNYANIFLFSDNNEVILSSNRAAFSEAIADPAGMGWGGTNPTQDMVDKYNMKNGMEITDPASGYNAQDPYKDRDPGFYASINYHGAVHKNVTLSMLPGGNQDPAIGETGPGPAITCASSRTPTTRAASAGFPYRPPGGDLSELR